MGTVEAKANQLASSLGLNAADLLFAAKSCARLSTKQPELSEEAVFKSWHSEYKKLFKVAIDNHEIFSEMVYDRVVAEKSLASIESGGAPWSPTVRGIVKGVSA